jgi:glycerol-3-phosphate dehydrogenase
VIERNPKVAAQNRYDVIVVGGGIYGACVMLEAARRGKRTLLLERQDFGGATSWNSLRILHGGLRYLQTCDMIRFRESVRERRWFCRYFPELVQPLACLMPLYGRGLKRPIVMRAALALNDWLSYDRNQGVGAHQQLPPGSILGGAETIQMYPEVDRKGLLGGCVWYDAQMTHSQRVLIEILHWACARGGTALNYVGATRLLTSAGRVAGVVGRDEENDESFEYRAPTVINCAGPWSREVAESFDRDWPSLFQPSLAFNVLFDRQPLSSAAVAVQSKAPGSQVHFLVPWHGKQLAGTVHLPWQGPPTDSRPAEAQIQEFLDELNSVTPASDFRLTDIVRVFAGFLPTAQQGSAKLAKRPVVHKHWLQAGPQGLVSLSGIKYTTARAVAEQALRAVTPARPLEWDKFPRPAGPQSPFAAADLLRWPMTPRPASRTSSDNW